MPLDIGSINTTNHPVKVGISDAYYMDRATKDSELVCMVNYVWYPRYMLDEWCMLETVFSDNLPKDDP